MISVLVSSRAASLTPYTPGEQPRNREYIKLNTNENPYPPAPAAAKVIADYKADDLRLYPDPQFRHLREAIAGSYNLKPEEVFAGNGSDEILSFAFYAFFDSSRGPVLFPEHTYSFYPVYCGFYELPFQILPLRSDFSIDLSSYLGIENHTGMVFPNPNAPTGIGIDPKDIRSFLDRYRSDRICIIDEAYIDFGGRSCAGLIREYDNLLLIHTLSKSRSLAGLRVGYALGNPDLIQTLFTVKDSFNSYPINRLSHDIAVTAMKDRDYSSKTQQKIIATRDSTVKTLTGLGWEVLPSMANFIFARLPGISGEQIYLSLKERGILVRHFNHPGISDFIRITIGTESDMEIFIHTLKDLRLSRR